MKQNSLLNHRLLFQGVLLILAVWLPHVSHAQVNANFAANRTAGCSPLSVQFEDLSTGPINKYTWDLGNGNVSRIRNPFVIYTTPGTYTISLTVEDTVSGVSSNETKTAYITVYEEPNAAFSMSQTSGCTPFTVDFTDLSTSTDGTITSWLWDFGDGSISSLQNPSHTYTNPGLYDVTLVVEDDNGCQNAFTDFDVISVTSVASIDFSADQPYACSGPHTVNFTPSVSPPSLFYSYAWDFGDGATSTASNPSHTYSTNGTYDVTLTVTDQNGCTAVESKNTYIQITNPQADFTPATVSACVGQPLQFFNTSIGADGFDWSFGDGNTSTARDPSHTYLVPGTYSVSLTATNTSFGCFDTEVKTALVTVSPSPSVNFSSTDNITCQAPAFVNFTDNSIGGVSWLWNFGDGSTSSSPNGASHSYTTPGSYNVSLTVTNSDGCSSTETKNAFVQISPPAADFIAGPLTEGCLPLTVNFLDVSAANEAISTHIWFFGDGTNATGANVSHTYTTAGDFDVTLVVITNSGCRDTLTRADFIQAGNRPLTDFTANPVIACLGADIDFTDQSSLGTEWEWTFGNGATSTQQNPTVTFADTGDYDVTLIVGYFGCYDTLTRTDYISIIGPTADFTPLPDAACSVPGTINFFDQSTSADQWLWDFGDGGLDSIQNPSHTYTAPGTYNVTLFATESASGCTDNFTYPVTVSNPIADFSATPGFSCPGLGINFTNGSSNATSYLWDFGDGNTSTAVTPTHSYTNPGTYTVTLIASDGTCTDTLTRVDYLETGGATPDFSADLTNGCLPLTVQFTDASIPFGPNPIVGYIWDFGDGNVSSSPNPIHTYTTAGNYTVTLSILDSQGCLTTETKSDYINPTTPIADFVSNDTISCPDSFIQFASLASGTGLVHLWDFGDGTTSSAVNPLHVFPSNGSYTISLTVTDINGCSDTRVKNNYVNVGKPTANFVADTTSSDCPPLTVNFINQSSADVVNWYWDFGDGSVSNIPSPSKVYNVAGDFDVRLIVESIQGCRDTMTQADMIQISGPTGSFTFGPKIGCNPLEINFSGTGVGVVQYTWDFGDGTGGIGQNISHIYTSDTVARPIMLIRDINGCQVAVTSPDSVVITPLPNPSFTVNYSQICLGQIVNFTNTTTSERSVVSYLWDFGDGNTSSNPNPQHTYFGVGNYDVTLTATTADGCVDSTITPITISVVSEPIANFTVDTNEACVPSSISFTDQSSGTASIVSWSWDFGDGDTDSGPNIFPHLYDSAGVYTATLTIEDANGCSGSVSRPITINPLPQPDFYANRYGCSPRSILFNDSTSGSANIASYFWDFGDGGATDTVQNPTHTFASDGTYTISLTVTDVKGCTNSISKTDYIRLSHPNTNFTSDVQTGCPPLDVNFSDLSSSDTTVTWFWDFGDGTTSTDQNPSHTYLSSNTFDVTLIVTSIFGCSDTLVRPNFIRTYQLPTAIIDMPDSIACLPENISMQSISTLGDTSIANYLWDFGNGINQNGANVSYLYTLPGIYTASLVITDNFGCRDTAYKNVFAYNNPEADFMAVDTVGCAITNILFNDLSTGVNPIVAWDWKFGDGNTGSVQNPTNTYLNDGIYDVTLTVTDNVGCSDSLLKSDYIVLDHPTAEFDANTYSTCETISISLIDQSTGQLPIVAWNWDFGDGNTSTQQNPAHTYSTPGFYTIRLIITDSFGCQDTITKNNFIQVFAGATPSFTISDPLNCTPLNTTFTDTSTPGDAAIIGWNWDFGDGGSSPVQNPTYIYNTAGVYTITLTTLDGNGCFSSTQQTVEALAAPIVQFAGTPRYSCSPVPVDFTDFSTSPYVLTQWQWDFGDGNTSNINSPTHTYLNDGVYDVKLVVTDQNGCSDSTLRTSYIRLDHPSADFAVSATETCPNNGIGVSFTDTSTPDTTLQSWQWDFGDGNFSILQNPTHIYSSPGNYTVTLVITNVVGCTDTVVKTNLIDVRIPPTTSFSINDSADCVPFAATFLDASTAGDAPIVSWYWDFGNGDTSLLQNPGYTFINDGVYAVSLTTTDLNGCFTRDTVNVEAYPLPVVDFLVDQGIGCSTADLSFTDLTTSAQPITDWVWDFGDGQNSTLRNPLHTYTADGYYTVSLTTTDGNGCINTESKTDFIVLRHPIANFGIDKAIVCPEETVNFTDLSIQDTTLQFWNWDFGDGNTSTLQNPSHQYASPGTYTVSLIIDNILGCGDTIVFADTIRVVTPSNTQFSPSIDEGCEPLDVDFTDTSIAGDSPILTWHWDFGNGDTSIAQNPTYTFATAGIYTVTLSTTDGSGCMIQYRDTITVNALPSVDFSATVTKSCSPFNTTFIDLTTSAAPITSWDWDFGDGKSSIAQNPTNSYLVDGNFTVSLTVEDANGCRDSLTKIDYIRASHPVAEFTVDRDEICPGDSVQFTDLTTGDTTLFTWIWDFGDGFSSSNQNPSHSYQNPGSYTVSLTVTDVLACSDVVVKTDTIFVNTPPTVSFAATDTANCEPHTVSFTDLSTGSGVGIVAWSWDFDNGNTSTAFAPPQQSYTSGIYQVQLTVTDANGCSSTDSLEIESFSLPAPDFSVNQEIGCAPVTLNFTDLSSSDRTIISWTWDFGNGNSSNLRNPSQAYAANGNYDISLTVVDNEGCSASITRSNFLNLRDPIADFTLDQNQGCTGLAVNFTDLSISDTTLISWQWDFGDGNASLDQNPAHTYYAPGTYTVSLTIRDAVNCAASVTKVDTIEIFTSPTSIIAASDTLGCAPFSISFNDISVGASAAIASRIWYFGDGDSSTNINPTHVYSTPGNYIVTLRATDLNGCYHDTTQTIYIKEDPTADFFSNIRNGCAPIDIPFVDISTGTAVITNWLWDFGDGNTSTQQFPTHRYISGGSYTVSLQVTDQFGCTNTLNRNDYIDLSRPIPNFTYDQFEGCPGLVVNFTDSSIPDTTLSQWLWDFGDGNTSTASSPSHVYTSPGLYSVSLTITNVLGCDSTMLMTDIIEVLTGPSASFTSASPEGCIPFDNTFTNSSTAGSRPIVSYAWDFGDGNGSGTPNPSHTFDSAGIYQVWLYATDQNGCTDSSSLSIEALSLPTSNFIASDSVGCAPTAITFLSMPTGDRTINTFRWNFGDGNTSTQQFPNHTYTSDGIFDVDLIVEDVKGCTDTLVKSQYIRLDHPTADFLTSATDLCANTEMRFTDITSHDTTIASWFWDFGDGNTSTLQNPTHSFTSTGTYTISLTVTDIFGCSHTESKIIPVTIVLAPTASFSMSNAADCVPLPVDFTDGSVGNSAAIVAWQWDFGDGFSSTSQNPSHTFQTSGNFDVRLFVTDANGCTDSVIQQVNARPLPLVDFMASDTIDCAPISISFTDLTTSPSILTNWRWDFGNGDSSLSQNPSYTYNNNGSYTISLEVRDQFGCTDRLIKPTYISLSRPRAEFTIDTDVSCPGVDILFTDTSTPDTVITDWLWDFGDGFTSDQVNPRHAYAGPGRYTVSLTITNINGCSDTQTRVDTIEIVQPPIAGFVPDQIAGCPPLVVNFANTSIQQSFPITSWNWDFDNGNTSVFPSGVSETFTAPGIYTVKLTATDASGCLDSAIQTITVHSPPVARFYATDTIGCAPFFTEFADQSTGANQLAGWQWNFGDGSGSTLQFPNHTYTTNGIYTVSMIVEDENSCRDTLVRNQYIRLSKPQADFTANKQVDCQSTSFSFTDTSIPDTTIANWQWDFGDGNTSILQNPSHTYHNPGTYDVRLIVTNVLGCSDTITQSNFIRIFVGPQASFVLSDSTGCAPVDISFLDQSVANESPITNWNWDFGNGNTSTVRSPIHTFTRTDTFLIQLSITDNNNCRDTVSRYVRLTPKPASNFQSLDTIGCAPLLVQFDDLTRSEVGLTNWFWDFGNGSTSTDQNPSVLYPSEGNFTVRLVVEDVLGCQDTVIKTNYIRLDNPDADFTADQTTGCPGLTVGFSDISVSDTSIVRWEWDFGDGTSSIEQNPQHTYGQAGNYSVRLIITNRLACSDTIIKNNFIQIWEAPTTAFDATQYTGCGPFQANFVDRTSTPLGISNWIWQVNGDTLAISQNASYFFQELGEDTVTLTTIDTQGCSTSFSRVFEVDPVPNADFIVSDSLGCAPVTLLFNDNTDIPIVNWTWDFGDGNSASEQNPAHTFTQDGDYTITLTVETGDGCIDTRVATQLIRLDHPEANFSFDYDLTCVPVRVNFAGEGTGRIPTKFYEWQFGDGNYGTGDSVMNAYALAGNYDVSLTITDSLGCQATVQKNIFVSALVDQYPGEIDLYHASVISDSTVRIVFAPTQETNFEQYVIYRESKVNPGVYNEVHRTTFKSDTIYVDTVLDTRTDFYCYKITMINECGTESSLSTSAEHCTIELQTTAIPDQIVLDWSPYRGFPVSQYEIYRVQNYNPIDVSFLAVVPGNRTYFEDATTECFNAYHYRIKAIGPGELYEAWSDTSTAANARLLPSATSRIVRATVENDEQVLVEWSDSNLPGEDIIFLERKTDNGNWEPQFTLPPGENKLLDEKVNVHFASYAYRVASQDTCGYRTDFSNTGKTILLSSEREGGLNRLRWTPYEEWPFGVDRYEIEVFNDTLGQYVTVDVVQGNITEYDDNATEFNQEQYCYRITAHELGGDRVRSISNETCLQVITNLSSANAFTPNDDGVNDVFTLQGIHVKTFNLKIYSRWGLLLFETNNIDEGWNGRYKGEAVREGVYVYIVKGVGFNNQAYLKRGTVTLLR